MLHNRKQRDYLDPHVLSRLAGLSLFARRPMQGNVSGKHRSPNRGASVEFAQYRKYVPGDDLRRLDWRTYGRTDRYYVKEFEADTNLRCCFVLDTSGSMNYRSQQWSKLDYAKRLVGTLAYLAAEQGDAVGISCVADGIRGALPPRRNPSHLRQLFEILDTTVCHGGTQLVPILHELAETTAQRALIILISDLFVPPEELRSCFQHLRFRKHDLAIFHLLDPQELRFQFQRPTRFLDLEGGTPIFVDPSEIADRYHRALQEYSASLQRVVLETAVDYTRVSSDQDYEQVLIEFLTRRMRGRGG